MPARDGEQLRTYERPASPGWGWISPAVGLRICWSGALVEVLPQYRAEPMPASLL